MTILETGFFSNFMCKYYTQYRECLQFVSANSGLELSEICTLVKYAFG